jgi:hypothetical protein
MSTVKRKRKRWIAVAVGTALSGRPPRRSQRAELPHWAPTSGGNAQTLHRASSLPYPLQCTLQVCGFDVGTFSWLCPRFLASCPFRVVHIEPYRHCVRNLVC